MIGQTEFTAPPRATIIDKEGLKQFKEWGVSNYLKIDGDLLGAQNWAEMLALTQNDKKERGLVVSINGNRLLTSKIFKTNDDKSIAPPLIAHGPRSFIPTRRDIVHVHTHFMPEYIDNIQTTGVSDTDINGFANYRYKAMVMIDRGGLHMLARQPFTESKRGSNPIVVERASVAEAKAGGNTAIDMVRGIARRLEPFGIRYYYSPNHNTTPEGFITLKDATKQ